MIVINFPKSGEQLSGLISVHIQGIIGTPQTMEKEIERRTTK
jgi:hypothetical protein